MRRSGGQWATVEGLVKGSGDPWWEECYINIGGKPRREVGPQHSNCRAPPLRGKDLINESKSLDNTDGVPWDGVGPPAHHGGESVPSRVSYMVLGASQLAGSPQASSAKGMVDSSCHPQPPGGGS